MAKSRGSARRDDVTDDVELPPMPAGETPEGRSERDIDDVLAQVGAGAEVRILRVNPDTGNPAIAGKVKAEDFSLDLLMEHYGGGSYILKVFDGKELVGKVPYEVDASIPARNPRAPKGVSGQPVQQSPQDLLMAIVAGQADSSRKSMELMTTMMAGFAQAMTGIVTATRAVAPAPAQNPLELLKAAADIIRPTTPARSALGDLKDMIEVVDVLRGENAGSGDAELALVGKAIDTVGKIVERQPMPSRTQAPPAPALAFTNPPAGPLPVGDTIQLSPSTGTPMRLWMKEVEPHLPMLRAVIGHVAPQTAASMIDDVLNKGSDVLSPAFGDLVQDITDGLVTGQEVTPELLKPFAGRVIRAFRLSPESELWLTHVAIELLAMANDELGEEEAPSVPVGTDGQGTPTLKLESE